MVDGRGGDNGFGLADIPVNLLKALHEAGNGARADGDMVPDLYVAPTQFAPVKSLSVPGSDSRTRFRRNCRKCSVTEFRLRKPN